ncbi:MAG: HAMP domain-containing sensor histidine kinase [Caldimonas sp.]
MDDQRSSSGADDAARRAIAEHVHARSPQILAAWQVAIAGDSRLTTNRALPRGQLLDHLPLWLDDFAEAVGASGLASGAAGATAPARDANQHGLQRWQQGFDVREVVREWAWLHEIVVAEIDAFAAAHRPAASPTVLADTRLRAAKLLNDAVVESVARYFELERMEAAGSVRDLEAALDELREVEQQRASLWHEAAHDLRGNLGVVTNVARGLSFAELPDERRNDFVRMLVRNLDSLHRLLDDVTGLARLQAGHEQRRVETYDAAAMLRSLGDEYRPLAAAKQLELRSDGPDAFVVDGDPVKTRRIAQNLLINAIKYTASGSIELSWGDAPAHGDTRWSFHVRDTGPGFHAGPGAPIFDAIGEATDAARTPDSVQVSRPVDSRPTIQEAGEGIGLAIVKRLAEVLDATVELDSAVDAGSEFRVVLPRSFPS